MRLTKAAVVITLAGSILTPAHTRADPGTLTQDDQTFMHLLNNDGLLYNFELERYQGQLYCLDVMGGENPQDAGEKLMRTGGYSRVVARSISAAAAVAYCWCANYLARMGFPTSEPCRQWETTYGRIGSY